MPPDLLLSHSPIYDFYPAVERRKRKEGEPDPLENALGKFAPSSSRAPRLLLKLVVEGGVGDSTPYKSMAKEGEEGEKRGGFRERGLALAIEDMFCELMVLEDLTLPKGMLEGQEKKNQEKKEVAMKELMRLLRVDQPPPQSAPPFSGKFPKFWGDADKYLMDIVAVRKGQRLIARCLPHLPLNTAAVVMFTLFRNVVVFLDSCEASGESVLADSVNRLIIQHFPLQFINHSLGILLASPTHAPLQRIRLFKFSQNTSFVDCLLGRAHYLSTSATTPPPPGGSIPPPAPAPVWTEFRKLQLMLGNAIQ